MSRKTDKIDIDRQFEAYLKESLSTDESTIESARAKAKSGQASQPWWMTAGPQDDDVGLSGTGKIFLKKKTPDIPAQSKESLKIKLPMDSYDSNLSKDSLDTQQLLAKIDQAGHNMPHLSLESSTTYTEAGKVDVHAPGMDTLDEIRDKENFFKNLEEDVDHVDYGRLNQELDQSDTLLPGTSPAKVSDSNSALGAVSKPSMLDNVALLDSMDRTLGTTDFVAGEEQSSLDRRVADNRAVTTGGMEPGLMTADTSEMAALHQAYQLAAHASLGTNQIRSGPLTTLRSQGSLPVNEASEASQARDEDGTASFGLRNVRPTSDSAVDGNERTVDDILREVAEIEGKVQLIRDQSDVETPHANEGEGRGFDLSPVHGVHSVSERLEHDDYDLVRVVDHSPDPKAKLKNPNQRPQPAVRRSLSPDNKRPTTGKRSGLKSPSGSRTSAVSPTKKKGSTENLYRKDSKSTPKKKVPNEADAKKTPKKSTPVKRVASPKKFTSPTERNRTGRTTDIDNNDAKVESCAKYIRANFADKMSDRKSTPEVRYSLDEPTLSNSLRVEKVSYIEREKVLMEEVKEWQERWKEERRTLAKTKADLVSVQKEHKRQMDMDRLEHQEEMFKLKQENFVLAAKISDKEERERNLITSSTEALDEATRKHLAKLEKEIQDQEKLIVGYQQENEKLYAELKRKQILTKGAEEKMFTENQRLTTEVMNLRSQLEQKDVELKNKGVITSPSVQHHLAVGSGTAVLGAGRIAQLEDDLKQAKRVQVELEQELRARDESRRELESMVETLSRERGAVEDRVASTRHEGDHIAQTLKHEYESEIEKLKKKLRWYAENQELLNQDSAKIRQKDDEIESLRQKIEEMSTETGKKKLESKARLKERAADAKRIMDLERQVGELESILRKRNPDSIPALMYAAASQNAPKTPSMDFLEKQVKKLEEELAARDEDDKREIRALQQQFNAMKIRYDARVEELERELGPASRADQGHSHPHTHTAALQKELDSVRERGRKSAGEKDAEIERLHKELSALRAKYSNEERREQVKAKETESELELRIRALQQEIKNKENKTKSLEEEVRKLKTEKDLMVIDSVLHQERHLKEEAAKNQTKNKRSKESPKQYEPEQFKGVHISDVVKENDDLKLQLEKRQLELNQMRVDLSKALAEKEASLRQLQDDVEDQLASLKHSHKAEVERLVTQHAVQHSDSKVAELQAKLETQELMVSHLKEQCADARQKSEEVSVLRIREAALHSQVQQLLSDLRDAKRNHTPEMHHYEDLLTKVRQLESRQSLRDSDLEHIIDRNKRVATANLEKENAKWRKIVESKNAEVLGYREELDAMLEILRELQRQGVVVPHWHLKT